MNSKKKLVLTKETLVKLSMRTGIKTGDLASGGNGGNTVYGSVCDLPTHKWCPITN